ncbi:MAG: class I SAM-dependent methyltransferase [Spirosomaceae bacterium]|nr:class I SAM-dependent methyltransferase [Spirosomataceae bacterium]
MSIQKAYNIWADQYDTNQNKTRDLDQIITRQVLEKYNFSDVIELGCGTGKNTKFLLKKARGIVGIDFSEEMLKKAKAKFKNQNVVFQQNDLTLDWNLPDASADLITCSLVLEHIQDLGDVFGQVYQKLQSGGIFFISELHPFKQYAGSKARFETDNGTQVLQTYTHHISDFLNAAQENNLKLIELNEWFDEKTNGEIPRLISFVFSK